MGIESDQDLQTQLNDETRMILLLLATDALSGTTISKRVLYGKTDIRHGAFATGDTFEGSWNSPPSTPNTDA